MQRGERGEQRQWSVTVKQWTRVDESQFRVFRRQIVPNRRHVASIIIIIMFREAREFILGLRTTLWAAVYVTVRIVWYVNDCCLNGACQMFWGQRINLGPRSHGERATSKYGSFPHFTETIINYLLRCSRVNASALGSRHTCSTHSLCSPSVTII